MTKFCRRILAFPFGNNVEYASFYLEQAYEEKPKEDWYACVQFTLVIWNVQDPSIYMYHSKSRTRLEAIMKGINIELLETPRLIRPSSCKS